MRETTVFREIVYYASAHAPHCNQFLDGISVKRGESSEHTSGQTLSEKKANKR